MIPAFTATQDGNARIFALPQIYWLLLGVIRHRGDIPAGTRLAAVLIHVARLGATRNVGRSAATPPNAIVSMFSICLLKNLITVGLTGALAITPSTASRTATEFTPVAGSCTASLHWPVLSTTNSSQSFLPSWTTGLEKQSSSHSVEMGRSVACATGVCKVAALRRVGATGFRRAGAQASAVVAMTAAAAARRRCLCRWGMLDACDANPPRLWR